MIQSLVGILCQTPENTSLSRCIHVFLLRITNQQFYFKRNVNILYNNDSYQSHMKMVPELKLYISLRTEGKLVRRAYKHVHSTACCQELKQKYAQVC